MLKLSGFSALHSIATDPPADYRKLLSEVSGQPVRRLSRFAALALTGAMRCRKSVESMRPDTALYFCSEQPNIADMSRTVHGITIENRPPTPLEFLAVSSNVTGFHVAKFLGLQGPNLTLCRSDASFEAGLELALLTQTQFGGALVSYVEDSAWPLEQHRIRVGWPANGLIAECSHWLYFDNHCAKPLAILEKCERYASMEDARSAFAASTLDVDFVSVGMRIEEDESLQWLSTTWPSARRFHFMHSSVFSKGLTAYALCRFLEQGLRGRLININRAACGEIYVVTMNVG